MKFAQLLLLAINVFANEVVVDTDTTITPVEIEDLLQHKPIGTIYDEFKAPVGTMSSCGAETDQLSVSDVVITPYPIKSGKPVTVSATAFLKKTITPGAMLKITAKVGFVTVFERVVDICYEAGKSKKPCPILPGNLTNQLTDDLPGKIPPTNIKLIISATYADGSPLVCLDGILKIGS